jgi:pimeloyl-ACP methyl ester carboxylesterase
VAAGRTDVAFVIAITGGGVSPKMIEMFDYERRLLHNGISGPDLDAARKTLLAYFGYLAGTVPRSEVTNLLETGKGKPWPAALGMSRVLPDESTREAWAWVATFDPKPSLAALRGPVLALIGGRDRDPAVEVTTWQEALRENPSPRTEIRVVPGAGHELTLGDSHAARIFNREALDGMAAWAASIPARKASS